MGGSIRIAENLFNGKAVNDTDPKITLKLKEMMQKKTEQERLIFGCSMFDFSKQLVMSSILQKKPHLSAGLLRRELFLRFYGNDFNSDQQEKIVKQLTDNL